MKPLTNDEALVTETAAIRPKGFETNLLSGVIAQSYGSTHVATSNDETQPVTIRKNSARTRRRRKRLPEFIVVESPVKDADEMKGGLKARILQTSNQIVMLKVLRDIKKELSEQKKKTEEQSLQDDGEYSDGSINGSSISDLPIEFEDTQRPVPKCTVLHYSPFKAVWDWVVLLLVLYTACFTPYIVAFLVNENDTMRRLNDDQVTRLKNADQKAMDPLAIVDLCVDIMFIIDIIINFRTTFVQGGEVVSDSRRIAHNYLRGWFVIDAVAAIPFDLLLFGSGKMDTLTACGVLKLARLLRLLRVARRTEQYSQYAAATLLLMLISFAMIGHWLACIFYAVGYMERKYATEPVGWLDALAVQYQQPYLPNDTTSGPDLKSRYVTAMYFTMTTLTSIGFGNVAPNTNGEKVFSIIAMMIGALMSAAIFGNFSSIMMRMYQGSEEMQQKTKSIQDFIKHHTITGALSKRMHEAFHMSWNDTNGVDMNSVLKSFPEQIQADICLHLNKNLLNNNQAFKGASPGCLRALSLRFTTTHAPPGDNLIHVGDIVNSMYFIARGSIELLNGDTCMAILGRGDIFGISVDNLNAVVKSNYSVHALTFCDMNKIEAYDLQDIFDMYPEFTEHFKKKFTLTFNLKMGEYTTLVSPTDMDEETLKLIKQKKPKMQCKTRIGDMTASSTADDKELGLNMSTDAADSMPVWLESKETTRPEVASAARATTIELTPAGLVGRSFNAPMRRNDKQSGKEEESKLVKRVTIEEESKEPAATGEHNKGSELRQLLLTAASLHKETMNVASNVQSAASQLEEEVAAPAAEQSAGEETQAVEVRKLQAISDKIDECVARAQRVEEHWNQSMESILLLLGQAPNSEIKSYV